MCVLPSRQTERKTENRRQSDRDRNENKCRNFFGFEQLPFAKLFWRFRLRDTFVSVRYERPSCPISPELRRHVQWGTIFLYVPLKHTKFFAIKKYFRNAICPRSVVVVVVCCSCCCCSGCCACCCCACCCCFIVVVPFLVGLLATVFRVSLCKSRSQNKTFIRCDTDWHTQMCVCVCVYLPHKDFPEQMKMLKLSQSFLIVFLNQVPSDLFHAPLAVKPCRLPLQFRQPQPELGINTTSRNKTRHTQRTTATRRRKKHTKRTENSVKSKHKKKQEMIKRFWKK